LPATVETNEFFCVNCRLTAGLDIHGRCATCGSDAVTHPLRYRLILLAADDCCIREKKVPIELSIDVPLMSGGEMKQAAVDFRSQGSD
jgi:hypothetical protein